VRRLGFGAMRVRREPGRGVEVMRRAVELGADLVDTADVYGAGTSEELIAEALYPYPEGVVVTTKGGIAYDPDEVLRACEADGIGFIPWRPLGDGYAHDPVAELRWLLDRSPVMLPIPGTSSLAHLEQNMRAA
jgi:aryl-alcohol dehydrogenase-like predicted oxidoreductase